MIVVYLYSLLTLTDKIHSLLSFVVVQLVPSWIGKDAVLVSCPFYLELSTDYAELVHLR